MKKKDHYIQSMINANYQTNYLFMLKSHFLSFQSRYFLYFSGNIKMMMENNRVKCTIDNDLVKLINKDAFDIVMCGLKAP